jgi:hypothetical protein
VAEGCDEGGGALVGGGGTGAGAEGEEGLELGRGEEGRGRGFGGGVDLLQCGRVIALQRTLEGVAEGGVVKALDRGRRGPGWRGAAREALRA